MNLSRWGILVAVLAVAMAFQNCSISENSEGVGANKQLSGNGTGYGGKPKGKYYSTNESVQCTIPGSQEVTAITGILEFADDGTIYYTDGCDESQKNPIDVDDLTISAANKNIIGYRSEMRNFEMYESIPLNLTTEQYIYASCYFLPLQIRPGGIIDINIVLRNSDTTSHETELYYSVFSEDLSEEYSRAEEPFTSLENAFPVGFYTYTSATRPDFRLVIQDPDDFSNPPVNATLQATIEGQVLTQSALYCLYN